MTSHSPPISIRYRYVPASYICSHPNISRTPKRRRFAEQPRLALGRAVRAAEAAVTRKRRGLTWGFRGEPIEVERFHASLGGGNSKTQISWEMIKFDEHIFQMG